MKRKKYFLFSKAMLELLARVSDYVPNLPDLPEIQSYMYIACIKAGFVPTPWDGTVRGFETDELRSKALHGLLRLFEYAKIHSMSGEVKSNADVQDALEMMANILAKAAKQMMQDDPRGDVEGDKNLIFAALTNYQENLKLLLDFLHQCEV